MTPVKSQCRVCGHTWESDPDRYRCLNRVCRAVDWRGGTKRTRITHSLTYSSTYRSWAAMKQRVLNPNNNRYSDYGGAGVKLHEPWKQFENFLADMGERPVGKSLDRYPDPSGDYKPSNCRWATPKEQANNTRSNHVLTVDGVSKTMSQWSDELGMKIDTLSQRIARGWSTERALTQPIQIHT